jgi:hydrogenase maturation protease
MSDRVLVACVGNLLRRDDGFGPAVAARLEGRLPPGAELVETGIGGVALLQELLAGCSGVVVVDAVERGLAPGTVVAFEPEVDEAEHVADVHLADPRRVLSMARTMGALPPRVRVVGCQPADVDELDERLSPRLEPAVERAARTVEATVRDWLQEAERAPF